MAYYSFCTTLATQRIRLVLVDRPVKLTFSSRIDRSGLPDPHQHHYHTLSHAQPLVCLTCTRDGTAIPTPRETAQSPPLPWYFFESCPKSGTATPTSVFIGITEVASGNASHDPHTVGTNERATPLAPRQVGVELVAQRTPCGPSQWRDVQLAETSVAPVRKHLLLSRVLVPRIILRGCGPGRERTWNCERLTKVPPVAVPFVRFRDETGCKGKCLSLKSDPLQ